MANASEILERLMIKTNPQSFQDVDIGIPKPQERQTVVLETPIIDKRTDDFSRADFMKTLVEKQIVTPKPLSPIESASDTSDTSDTQTPEQASVQTPEQASVVLPKPPSIAAPTADSTTNVTPRLRIVRKLQVKLKLVQPDNVSKPTASKRLTPKPTSTIKKFPESSVKIGNTTIEQRTLNTKKAADDSSGIKADAYYLANREKFVGFITRTYSRYKKELDQADSETTCENDENTPFSPMAHQKIVRDYMSKYSPYRGILLFHGLGAGKTCSSIAIAEGLKTERQVIVMTPASLRMNYIEELKKCGDEIYKKNQFWEFVKHNNDTQVINTLSGVLSLPTNIIEKNGGAWLVNNSKEPNFETLSTTNKKFVDEQINLMISQKYKFINYNGIRKAALANLVADSQTKNPFDNKVVIIDEAHNFVSRIVNKLGREDTLSGALYDYIMSAENARIVLLSGTPIINYPNEIAILFNMLRGYIKTWSFKLNVEKKEKITQSYFENIFNNKTKSGAVMDYIDYNPNTTTLRVTRNPFGFVNTSLKQKHSGVKQSNRGQISDKDFEESVKSTLKRDKMVSVSNNNVSVTFHKPLPDDLKTFNSYFIDDKMTTKNMNMFKKRILGLSSYFRDVESLMPRYIKSENFRVVKVEMSDYQLGVYEKARKEERKMEKNNAKTKKKQMAANTGIFADTVSTYRIFSRAFCNFVFPEQIGRPLPGKNEGVSETDMIDEDDLDGLSMEEKAQNPEAPFDNDDTNNATNDADRLNQIYKEKVAKALVELERNKDVYLTKEALQTYSPKFLNILENVTDADHKGLHLIYSQFRTLEGIGIMKLMFEANGFAEFRLTRKGGVWDLDISEADMTKPKFVLYTGSETAEEKELIRNIFNGAWQYVPSSITEKLKEIHPDNKQGDIIKVIMITASGAEGISLKNVRYVHITEPYWHPVRTQQVIGRARRICSHQGLPIDMRTVDVFLYLMTLTEEQQKSDQILELRKKDKSKRIPNTPFTSDETLYEIATMKEDVTNEILRAVKESSFDCTLHAKVGDKEQLKCFTFGSDDPAKFAYVPAFEEEDSDNVAKQNQAEITFKAKQFTMGDNSYALDETTMNVYDLESYKIGNPVLIGKLVVSGTGEERKYELVNV